MTKWYYWIWDKRQHRTCVQLEVWDSKSFRDRSHLDRLSKGRIIHVHYSLLELEGLSKDGIYLQLGDMSWDGLVHGRWSKSQWMAPDHSYPKQRLGHFMKHMKSCYLLLQLPILHILLLTGSLYILDHPYHLISGLAISAVGLPLLVIFCFSPLWREIPPLWFPHPSPLHHPPIKSLLLCLSSPTLIIFLR